jgi:hypothetical protein
MNLNINPSSIVSKASYLANSKLLSVVLNGKTYIYEKVPSAVALAFAAAPSAGRFFSQQIKGKYDFLSA